MNDSEFIKDHKTGLPAVFYECDPQKAHTCHKRQCKEMSDGECDLTKQREHAKDDAQPFRVRRIVSDNGFGDM